MMQRLRSLSGLAAAGLLVTAVLGCAQKERMSEPVASAPPPETVAVAPPPLPETQPPVTTAPAPEPAPVAQAPLEQAPEPMTSTPSTTVDSTTSSTWASDMPAPRSDRN